jgi:lipoyl(octanoyl) transferase
LDLSYRVVYQDIGLRDYKTTWDYQKKIFNDLVGHKLQNLQVRELLGNSDPGTLIFVEHPHVFTLGKNGSANNLLLDYIQLKAKDATFYKTDRGGDITYHGPGQIVGYPIINLSDLSNLYLNKSGRCVIYGVASTSPNALETDKSLIRQSY